MKQLEVQIMGQSYLLGCPEGGDARLLDAVGRVDSAMCRIRDAGKVKARDRIAVLAALNLAFEQLDSAAAAAPVSPPAPAPASAAVHSASDESSPALVALIGRLDQALGDDGRLI